MLRLETRGMGAVKATDGRVQTRCEARILSALPQVSIASAVAIILAFALSIAFLPGGFAGLPAVESPWVNTAYAAETSDGDEGDSSSEKVSEGAADQASNDEAADSDASDDEAVAEEIEDDEVPMAQAIGVGRNIQFVIVAGVAIVVIAFALFMRRMNRSMDGMRRRFRS